MKVDFIIDGASVSAASGARFERRDPVTGRSLTEMPEPTTRLVAGDDLAVIGKSENLAQFRAALVPTVENPTG